MDGSELRDSLRRLAANHRWTWRPSTRRLLYSLPQAKPRTHPYRIVDALDEDQLGRLSHDQALTSAVERELASLDSLGSVDQPTIAYCSPEFALTAAAPQYAGGLGVLAGDHLREASDQGLSLAGIGLFYHLGAFRQSIGNGAQYEIFSRLSHADLGAIDTGIVVSIPFPGREVKAAVLKVEVGRVPLILLSTDVDGNSEADRSITDRLYMGSADHRVSQEMVLGLGGAKAIQALGWDIDLFHLNEGHAGFLTLELIDRTIEDGDLKSAVERVRKRVVFTTHTPVPAGISVLEDEILSPYLKVWADRWGVDPQSLWELGADPENPDLFNMAVFCLRMSHSANGVSKLHGEVSRSLFSGVPEGRNIGHVTNGVHARAWTSDEAQDTFDVLLGSSWTEGNSEAWSKVDAIDDERLTTVRRAGSEALARLVAEANGARVDPDALLIGFARRFAPYKRANLILQQMERLADVLENDDRPVHFLFAGKAHPANGLAKSLLSEVVGFSGSAAANGRFTFIPDYDMRVGAHLVQGCDIWLNNPIHPREASGTSGEKAALNGGLNCSILDGWWAEMFDGENGWAITSSQAEDPQTRDEEDSEATLDAVIAARDEYYASRQRFNQRIRHAWTTLGPQVTSSRMLSQYRNELYDSSG